MRDTGLTHGGFYKHFGSKNEERAFFVTFSTMVGAVEIARMLPDRAAQERVLVRLVHAARRQRQFAREREYDKPLKQTA